MYFAWTQDAYGLEAMTCRTYGEVALAEIAGSALFEMEPENPAKLRAVI